MCRVAKKAEYTFATCILFSVSDILQYGKMLCQQVISVAYAFSWVFSDFINLA